MVTAGTQRPLGATLARTMEKALLKNWDVKDLTKAIKKIRHRGEISAWTSTTDEHERLILTML